MCPPIFKKISRGKGQLVDLCETIGSITSSDIIVKSCACVKRQLRNPGEKKADSRQFFSQLMKIESMFERWQSKKKRGKSLKIYMIDQTKNNPAVPASRAT